MPYTTLCAKYLGREKINSRWRVFNINFVSKESVPLLTTPFVNEDLNLLVIREQQSNNT